MASSPQNPYTRRFEIWSKIASAIAIVLGCLVLIGWATDNVALMRLLPGVIIMKANAAAAFILAGLALWLLHEKPDRRWLTILRLVCSSLVLLVGILTLSQDLFGWNLGIDQLLFKKVLEYGGGHSGRMAPGSAGTLALLGAALLLRGDSRRTALAQIVTVPLLVSALIPIIGYVFGAESLFRYGSASAVVLPSSIIFLVLGIGINLVRPEEGAMAVLVSQGAAGFMARTVLPASILLPVLTGWLSHLTEASGRYEEPVVEAVVVVINVLLLTGVLAWGIRSLHGADLARMRTDDAIQHLHHQLEERVQERTAQLAEANQSVQQERDQLQVLMDNVPDTIYFKDAASRFTRVNAAQARTLGLEDPRQAIGKTDADFFAPETAAAAYAAEQHLIETGESLIDDREYSPTPEGKARWFSATKMPVYDLQGKVVGLVGISRDITDRISDEQSTGAEKAQLTERVEQMALVIELSEQLQACAADAEVYQVAARLAGRLFPGELGALYAIDPGKGSVETAVTWGEPPLAAQTFEVDDCWALRRGKAHYSGWDRPGEVCPHIAGSPATYSVCLPLSAAGDRLGILHLRTATGGEMHDSSVVQKQSAQLVAESLALAWANVRLRGSLHEQAVRDPLTGLYNRRHMQVSLERELRLAARTKKPIGIIMLDIDDFKAINDAHGHDAGDLVLREFGHFLRDHTREGDIPCRLGGEDFLVILPGATLEQTMVRAEKHRQNFSATRILFAGGAVPTPSLSIGVAAYPKHGSISEQLLLAADRAVHAAKEAGRDQVVAAE